MNSNILLLVNILGLIYEIWGGMEVGTIVDRICLKIEVILRPMQTATKINKAN